MGKVLGALCVLMPLAIAGVLVARAEDSPYKTPSAEEMRAALDSIPYAVEFDETRPTDDIDAFKGVITKGNAALDFVVLIGNGASDYVDSRKRQLVRGVPNFTSVGFGSTGEVIVLDSVDRAGRLLPDVLDLQIALEEAVGSATED